MNIKEIIEDLNSKTDLNPDELTQKLIDIFKQYAIEKNTTETSIVLMIDERPKFQICPIPISAIESDLGGMLMNSYVSSYEKETSSNVSSILKMAFGCGIKRDKDEDNSESMKAAENVKNKVYDCIESGGSIKDVQDVEEYMLISVLKPDEAKFMAFELIRGTDRTGKKEDFFVISDKPQVEHSTKYENSQFTNYFKKQ